MKAILMERLEILRRAVPIFGEDDKYQLLSSKYNLLKKDELKNRLREIFMSIVFCVYCSPDEIVEKLSYHGKLFFDINGLKAVNDLAGHESGDILLERVVKCFRESDLINNFISKYSLKIDLFREGGDEFSFLVYRESAPLSEKIKRSIGDDDSESITILQALREVIVEEVMGVDINDLLTKKAIKSLGKEGAELYEKTKGEFVFKASVAGSDIRLDQVLLKCLEEGKLKIFTEPHNQGKVGASLMGLTQQLSDRITQLFKDAYKVGLIESDNPNKVFEGYLITRSNEAKRLYAKILKLEKKIFFLTGIVDFLFAKTKGFVKSHLDSVDFFADIVGDINGDVSVFSDLKENILNEGKELDLAEKSYSDELKKMLKAA